MSVAINRNLIFIRLTGSKQLSFLYNTNFAQRKKKEGTAFDCDVLKLCLSLFNNAIK